MSIKKYVQRLKRMDALIKMKATGNPDQFAEKLEVSRRTLLGDLKEIKSLGCNISYCRTRESYVYEQEAATLSKILSKNI